MHKDNLLLLESFFSIEQYRPVLPVLIYNLNNQNSHEQTALLNQHIQEVSVLLGIELQIDRESFIDLIKKEKKVLLGRMRMMQGRVSRVAFRGS